MPVHCKHIDNSNNFTFTCMRCDTILVEFFLKTDTCQHSLCHDCTIHILTCEADIHTTDIQMYDNSMQYIQTFTKSQFLSLDIPQIFYDELSKRETSKLQQYEWPFNMLEMRVNNLLLEIKVLTEDFQRNRKVLTSENFCFSEHERQEIIEQVKVNVNKNKKLIEKYKEEVRVMKMNLIKEMDNVVFYTLVKEERFQEMVKAFYEIWSDLIGRSNCMAMTLMETADKDYKLLIECDRVLHE